MPELRIQYRNETNNIIVLMVQMVQQEIHPRTMYTWTHALANVTECGSNPDWEPLHPSHFSLNIPTWKTDEQVLVLWHSSPYLASSHWWLLFLCFIFFLPIKPCCVDHHSSFLLLSWLLWKTCEQEEGSLNNLKAASHLQKQCSSYLR
jgi:hypothetical protein